MITTSIRDEIDRAPIESIVGETMTEHGHEIVTDAIWSNPTRVYYRPDVCDLTLRLHGGKTREVAEVGHA